MKRFRLIGVALLALFAFGVVASVAQAEEAPSFTVGGTRLIAGKTHNIDAKLFAAFQLKTPGFGTNIKCSGLTTQEGVLLGSNPGNPGRDNEVTVFSGCKLEEGNGAPNCKLATISHGTSTETLSTNPLVSEQVENVESGHVGKKLLEEFLPKEAAKGFITLNFTGTCTTFQTKVSGEVVGESVLDNSSEGSVELGQTPQQRTSWLLRFPATAITEVWLISGGAGKAVETEQVAFGDASTQVGTALILLASTKYTPEPTGLWSPLP